MELPWTMGLTYLRGQQVFDGTKVAEPGTGHFVRPLPR
jgi:allantoinase